MAFSCKRGRIKEIEFVKEIAAEDVFVDDEDEGEEDIDENNQVVNAIIGLQAINE